MKKSFSELCIGLWAVLLAFAGGARAAIVTKQATLESYDHRPPRSLSQVRENVRRFAIDEICFQKGAAECPISRQEEKILRTRRVFKGIDHGDDRDGRRDRRGPRGGTGDPIWATEYTYEFLVELSAGASVADVFKVDGKNELAKMSEILFQQGSEGYWAQLVLEGVTREGRIFFDQPTDITAARGSDTLPLRNAIWGHPTGEWRMRFEMDGQTYSAHGKVETTDYVFGTDLSVTAVVENDRGEVVGSLKLDD